MIYIASDHAGYQLKKYLVDYIKNKLAKDIIDLGPKEFDSEDDFPDYAKPLAKTVAKENATGILICGSGNGVCITANKTTGIRAILGYSIEAAELGKLHNNANVLCLAGRVLSDDHAAAIVKKFLETKFNNEEKRVRRNKKIED